MIAESILKDLQNRTPTRINPVHDNVFLYPFETSENLWFSDVFSGYRKRLVACNRLISIEKSGLNRTEAAIGGAL